MVICLERGADVHTARLMPLPLTVSCFSKIQIGFTFLVLAHLGSPGKGPLNGCVCVCYVLLMFQCCEHLNTVYCRSNININDVLGDYSLTLVDVLDTLAVRDALFLNFVNVCLL